MKPGQSNSEANVLDQCTAQSLKDDHLRKVQAQIVTFGQSSRSNNSRDTKNGHLLCCKI